MEFCHENSILRSPAMQQLGQFVRDWRAQWADTPPDFEQFERELREQVMAVERELLAEELACYDVTAEQIEVEGVTYRQALRSSETYLSAAGPITLARHLYRPPGRGSRSICPLELRAGIMRGHWTPRAARQAAFVLAQLTPGDPEDYRFVVRRCLTNWEACSRRDPIWTGCLKSCPAIGRRNAAHGKLPCVLRKPFRTRLL
jgi:hypothetical protein